MTNIGLFLCLVLFYGTIDANGFLLKHLTPRPGGIIDSLTKPREPGGFHLGSHLGGGISFGLGSFGFNLGFNKQYVPGGGHLPPKDPHVPGGETGYPDGNPYVPGVKPGYPDSNPYVPGVKPGNPYVPGYPEDNPYIPRPKPVNPQKPVINPPKPDTTWEDEHEEKIPDYPPPKEKDYPKPGSYDDTSSPKREDKESQPNWEDIGEVYEKDPKIENYREDGEGIIQPRLNKKRPRRFIESKIYHVPLLFRSNAKPTGVRVQNSLNSLEKGLEK